MLKTVSKRSFFLILLDIAAVTAAFSFAWYRPEEGPLAFVSRRVLPLYLTYAAIFVLMFYLFDLYYAFKYFKPGQTLIDISLSTAIGTVIAAACAYADRTLILPRLVFVKTILTLVPLAYLMRMIYDFLFRTRFLDYKTLVLGTGPLAQQIVEVIKKTPFSGMEVIGLVAESRDSSKKNINGIPVAGNISNLLSLIDWYGIQLVVLAMDPKEEVSEAAIMAQLLGKEVKVTSSIHLFERLRGDVPYKLFGSHYLVGLMSQVRTRPYLKLKRLMDILSGTLLLIALSPVLLLAAFLLAFSGPHQIFFIQKRIGKDSRPFNLIKLRSMARTQKGKQAVTRLGYFLRKYRIDEIPQLINVIKGDMSLIGPRPEIPYFVDKCRKRIPFYDAVFTIKPGITGWAQVNFYHTRRLKDYDQKFRYNLYYLKNISLALDLFILAKTVRIILQGKGE